MCGRLGHQESDSGSQLHGNELFRENGQQLLFNPDQEVIEGGFGIVKRARSICLSEPTGSMIFEVEDEAEPTYPFKKFKKY